MRPLNLKDRLYRLWELLVIRYVLITGKGKRRREWIHYRRSMGGRKAAVTRKANRAARAGAADGNQAGSNVSDSFTPPGQSATSNAVEATASPSERTRTSALTDGLSPTSTATDREPYLDHESDAVQPA